MSGMTFNQLANPETGEEYVSRNGTATDHGVKEQQTMSSNVKATATTTMMRMVHPSPISEGPGRG